MKPIVLLLIFTLLSACNSKVAYPQIDLNGNDDEQKVEDEVTNLIFDTDMCFDVDDVGAMAVLHKLSDEGLANILAVVYNEVHPDGAAAIDAINTWYGRGNIPIGIYKKSLASPDGSSYLSAVAGYPNDIPKDLSKVPDALDVYKQALNSQKDKSVTIVSVGFLNNLADLLRAEPELVAAKVKKLIIMAGVVGDDFNTVRHNLVGDTQKVLEDWPTPIVISQVGGDIYSGKALEYAQDSPIRTAYYKWFGNSYQGRSSWDLLTALYAVKGAELFDEKCEGIGRLSNGYEYKMSKDWRTFITEKYSKKDYEDLLDAYLVQSPIKK